MSRLEKAWARLGRPEAIGWPVGVVFLPSVFFGSYAASFVDVSGRLLEFTGARVVSIAAMVIVLLLGRAALNTFATSTPRPLITVITIVVTVITGASVQNAMLIALDFTDTWNIAQRVIVAGPGIFTLLLLACLVVAFARESARTNSELADVIRQLNTTKGRTEDLAREKRDQLMDSVRTEIDQALAVVSSAKRDTVKDGLNSLLDDVVRPLSFRLAHDATGTPTTPRLPTSPHIVWSDAFRGALRTNPAHPNITTLWLGILVGVYLIISLGVPGVYAALFSAAIAWVALFLVRAFWSATTQMSLAAQGGVYSAIILAYSSGSAVVMTEISGYNFLLPHTFAGFVLLSLCMAWTISLIYGLAHTLDDTQSELETHVADLQRDVITLNNELRTLQKKLSRILHGPIQSTLLALIQRFDPHATEDQMVADMEVFRRTLEEALTAATQSEEDDVATFDEVMAELVEFWEDVAAITLSTDASTSALVNTSTPCSRAVIELIREACGNAIKHGQAKNITITLRPFEDQQALQLTVDNDGKPLQDDAIPGVGSRMLDDSSLSWRRYQAGPMVRLEAVVPRCEEAAIAAATEQKSSDQSTIAALG